MESNDFLLMDENKKFAIVSAVSLNMMTQYSSYYIKNLTTGKVIKKSIIDMPEPPDNIPMARPIKGYNKMFKSITNKEAIPIVTTIGYTAENGFKIPSNRFLDDWEIV